jgi:hypothetical protein
LAGFRLKRRDVILEYTELLKAHAAVRGRMTRALPDESFAALTRQFRDTSEMLNLARDTGAAEADLAVRRHWLRDMLAIARARSTTSSGEMPELTVANLQAALAEDEAAISYFWLNDRVILVVLIDGSRCDAQRIVLEPEQRLQLDEFLASIQQMSAVSATTNPAPFLGFDLPARRLGTVLFPAFCRDFVADKKRLIISPNHGLHLFPFHAARWEDEFLGVRFAVRYVPNLSSLLLPWKGGSQKQALVIGIPDCGIAGYRPLANVAAEVEDIQRCYGANGTTACPPHDRRRRS